MGSALWGVLDDAGIPVAQTGAMADAFLRSGRLYQRTSFRFISLVVQAAARRPATGSLIYNQLKLVA